MTTESLQLGEKKGNVQKNEAVLYNASHLTLSTLSYGLFVRQYPLCLTFGNCSTLLEPKVKKKIDRKLQQPSPTHTVLKYADKQAQMQPFLPSTQAYNRRLGASVFECKCACACACVDRFPCLVENADF